MYPASPSRPLNRRAGKVLVLVAICGVPMIGVTALAIDGGYMMAERRQGQNAADAAALAGTIDLYHGQAANLARETALKYAARNGYPSGDGVNTVTVNIPPIAGTSVGDPNAVEVLISRKLPKFFSGVFYPGTPQAQVRGVAAIHERPASDAALLVLDPSAKAALKVGGEGELRLSGGGAIVVNSNSPEAAVAVGSSFIEAPSIRITGTSPGYTRAGGAEIVAPIATGVPPTVDPLAGVPAPNPAALPLRSNTKLSIASSTVLEPGVYQGGIDISCDAVVTMNPGIYYIQAGAFTQQGQSSLLGKGVMIYAEQNVSITGSGSVQLSAPTDGTYDGICIFQSRTVDGVGVKLKGGANMRVTGSVYTANGIGEIAGIADGAILGSQWITKQLSITGNGSLLIQWNSNQVGQKRTVHLVE